MFYTFGSMGFIWVLLWVVLYTEVRGPVEEEFIQPPKVSGIYTNAAGPEKSFCYLLAHCLRFCGKGYLMINYPTSPMLNMG